MTQKISKSWILLFSFQGTPWKIDLVTIAKWSHLFPSRTQKLSTSAADIAPWVKYARCQVFFYVFFYFHAIL